MPYNNTIQKTQTVFAVTCPFHEDDAMNEFEFLQFLDSHEFTYERIVHPAVFTCSEAELHRPKQPTISTKNLFLCDKKARRFFLVVTACEKTMNLQNLADQIKVPKL